MADSLKALGKYGSEKPEEFQPVTIGSEGYTSAGSTHFYAGTVLHSDRLHRRTTPNSLRSRSIWPSESPLARWRAEPRGQHLPPRAPPAGATPTPVPGAHRGIFQSPGKSRPLRRPSQPPPRCHRPRSSLSCLSQAGKEIPSTLPRMSSVTAFFPTSSWPIIKTRTSPGRVFSAPTVTPRKPRRCCEKYIDGVKKDGAEVKTVTADGADEMVMSNNIGLVDVVFRKGNALAGANGATSAAPAEVFARALAKSLPATVPSTREQSLIRKRPNF